jgi:hypothetical protein
MLKEEKYYDIMNNFNTKMSFEEICHNWYACFEYILLHFKCGFNQKSIHSLFYFFDMDNWTALHRDQIPEYKDQKKRELLDSFCSEACYISDRVSYDRLFRTHWLFKQAFEKEFDEYKHSRKESNNVL